MAGPTTRRPAARIPTNGPDKHATTQRWRDGPTRQPNPMTNSSTVHFRGAVPDPARLGDPPARLGDPPRHHRARERLPTPFGYRSGRLQSVTNPPPTTHRQTEIKRGHSLDRGCDLTCGGRVDLYAGFCTDAHRARWRRRRPSISACRRRQALAAYPQASDGPPSSACAGQHPQGRWTLLGLAPGGVYLATSVTRGAGGLLPHRFTLTGPLVAERTRRSVFCGTFPRVTPGCC